MDIRLRPYALDDAPALLEAARESVDEVSPWLAWCRDGMTIEDAQGWVERQVRVFAERSELQFVVTDATGNFLGGCGLNRLNPDHRMANLGYWLRTSATGRGVAPRAVALLVEWAFANTDLERLEIVAAVGNLRSQRVAEKSGASREGVLRSRLFLHGRPHDAVMFSIVRERARES